MGSRRVPSKSLIKYEIPDDHDQDDIDAQLLTPQVTIDVAQRRKPFMQGRFGEQEGIMYSNEDEIGYDLDYVYGSDESQGGSELSAMERNTAAGLSRTGKRPSSMEKAGRAKKMYELDVTLYPEAAAARASYENRLRKKAEREEMLARLNFLTERNKVLEEENQVLKDKLLEYDMNVTTQDWLLFFRTAGIRSGLDQKYAAIFDENRIKPNQLSDLNEQWLRDMNITAVGDILAILRHSALVHAKTNGRKLHFNSLPVLQRAPVPPPPPMKKLPIVDYRMTKEPAPSASNKNGIVITSVCSLNQ